MTFWPGYPPPTPPKPPWYRNLMVWLWVYVGFAVLGCIALFALFVFTDDFEEYGDDEYYVEQQSVNQAVAEACFNMSDAGQDIKVFSTPAEGADALHRFVVAGRAIPSAIDTVDDADSSALRWRSDWITMLDALDSYADELEDDPDAEFSPPTDRDGDSLTFALSWVSDVPCALPPAVVALDPQGAPLY